MLHYFFLFLLALSCLIAEDNQTDSNLSDSNQTFVSAIAEPAPLKTNIAYLKHTPLRSPVYYHQVLQLHYNLLLVDQTFSEFSATFLENPGMKILERPDDWNMSNETTFKMPLYLKVTDQNFTLPTLRVKMYYGDTDYRIQNIVPEKETTAIELVGSEHFCGVMAKDFQLKKTKATTYDKRHNLMVLNIQAHYSNLDDFSLSRYERQGIESHEHSWPQSEIIYFAIIPKELQQFTLEYFDLESRGFKTIRIPNIIQDERISTQSDIRPKKTYQLYKIASLSLFIVIFGILFIFHRRTIHAVIMLVFIVLLAYLLIPQKVLELKKGASLHLLPSPKSTVFYIPPHNIKAKELMRRHGYIKIHLPNDKIGWVKESDVLPD